MSTSAPKDAHPDNKALIVIDVQYEYFPGGAWALPNAETALPNIVRLVEGARAKGVPVVFIQHALPEGAPLFAKGTKGVELHEALSAGPDDPVFQKQHPSSFQDTGLQGWLQQQKIGQLDICGFMTQMCCDTTSREAYRNGYAVRLFSDATAAKTLEFAGETIPHGQVHLASLAALSSFAQVISTQEA